MLASMTQQYGKDWARRSSVGKFKTTTDQKKKKDAIIAKNILMIIDAFRKIFRRLKDQI